MSYSLRMISEDFWPAADGALDAYVKKDDLHMVMMKSSKPMRVILRRTTSLFTDAAVAIAGSPTVIINGNMYDVSKAGLADAFLGSDPVEAKETTPLGGVVDGGKKIAGSDQPNMFHWSQVKAKPPIKSNFESGMGIAPTGTDIMSAMGGLGPLIIDGLKYGNGNEYNACAIAGNPKTGKPPAGSEQFLTQRNNNTFKSFAGRGQQTGKTIIAANAARKRVLVIVQQDGTLGQKLEDIRDRLVDLGFDNAVFLDGSDSSCLWHGGKWRVAPGPNKNETMTSGLAFG